MYFRGCPTTVGAPGPVEHHLAAGVATTGDAGHVQQATYNHVISCHGHPYAIGRVGISNDLIFVSLVVQVQGLKKYVHSNASLMYLLRPYGPKGTLL